MKYEAGIQNQIDLIREQLVMLDDVGSIPERQLTRNQKDQFDRADRQLRKSKILLCSAQMDMLINILAWYVVERND